MSVAQEHQSFPSIVQYYTFNEGWGQYDKQRIVQFAHALDPSRLWGPTSGWVDPQDQTFGLGSVFEHYSGYVSAYSLAMSGSQLFIFDSLHPYLLLVAAGSLKHGRTSCKVD